MAQGKKTGGRKKGTRNRRTQALQRKVAQRRCDPLEALLELQQWAQKSWRASLRKSTKGKTPAEIAELEAHRAELASLAADYANKAAPYVHARLAAVDASVEMTTHESALDELDD